MRSLDGSGAPERSHSAECVERPSEKSRRRPKRGVTGHRSGTVGPVLGPVCLPVPPSEGCSNPFSDGLGRVILRTSR